jgi:hypothetical protein
MGAQRIRNTSANCPQFSSENELSFALCAVYQLNKLCPFSHMPLEIFRKCLRVIAAPDTGPVLVAPPALCFKDGTTEFVCGHCAVPLMQGEGDDEPRRGLIIRCARCGTYNSTT